MKSRKQWAIFALAFIGIAVVIVTVATTSLTAQSSSSSSEQGIDDHQPPPGPPHGPPPEAYTACDGKCAGEKSQFTGPHGETITGTCEQEGDRLVLRPDHPPKRPDSDEETDDNDNWPPPRQDETQY